MAAFGCANSLRNSGLKAWVRSSTDQLHNVALQGPKSRDILRQVIWTPPTQPTVDELGWFRFTIGRIGGFDGAPVVVSRTGYTGELGYEIFCHPKDAGTVFDAIWNAGRAAWAETDSVLKPSTCCVSRRVSSSPVTNSATRPTRSRPELASPCRSTRRTTILSAGMRCIEAAWRTRDKNSSGLRWMASEAVKPR